MPNINNDSILFADGHSSYPPVARNLNFRHHIVNHTEGLRSEDGTRTNNNKRVLYLYEKHYEERKWRFRDHINAWLIQYTFNRMYILDKNNEEFSEVYTMLFKSLRRVKIGSTYSENDSNRTTSPLFRILQSFLFFQRF